MNGSHELKIVMSDWEGVTKYAQYGIFSIDSEQNYYRLHSGNYSGNAGISQDITSYFIFKFARCSVENSVKKLWDSL